MLSNGFGENRFPMGVELVEVDGRMMPINSSKLGEVSYGVDLDTGEQVRARNSRPFGNSGVEPVGYNNFGSLDDFIAGAEFGRPDSIHLSNLNKYLAVI